MAICRGVLFLCVIFISKSCGTIVPTLDQPRVYFERVTERFFNRIKEYGLSNLPVVDVELFYNASGLGHEIIGPVFFEDGFAMDVGNVSANERQHSTFNNVVESAVIGRIEFEHLQIFHDLRGDLEAGKLFGSVVLTPNIFTYSLRIAKAHNNDTVVPTLTFFSWNTLVWDLHPNNLVTNLMRRHYIATIANAANSGRALLTPTAHAWIPIFQGFLEEIVANMDYPSIII